MPTSAAAVAPDAVGPSTGQAAALTVDELLRRVGPVPLDRIRMSPPPGTATEADITAAGREGLVCELVDGVLVEKAVSAKTSEIAGVLHAFLVMFVRPKKLGFVLGEAGFVRLPRQSRWRAADVAFFRGSKDVLETAAYPELAPTIAVEVLSPRNTTGEMERKVGEFFAAGTELIWVIDPKSKTAKIYRSPDGFTEIDATGKLEGGDALPGFSVGLGELF